MDIVVASTNEHKLEELQNIFVGHRLISPRSLGIDNFDVEENGSSYFANALLKAQALHALTGRPCLADDSGLSVVALDGAPGIFSARYGASATGLLSASEKNELVLKKMTSYTERTAYFVCCLVLYEGSFRITSVEECLAGEIAQAAAGQNGFGYDPIMFLPKYNCTVAQLSSAEKNAISHRGLAAKKMLKLLTNS